MTKSINTKPFYNSTIPDDWEVKSVGQVCNKFLNGGTPSTQVEEYWTGNIPWITGADIVEQKISNVRKFITEEALKKSSTNVIPKGNLLLVTRTGVGKVSVTQFDVAISQDLTGLFLNEKFINTEFAFYFFDGNENRLKQLNQGTSINGITRNVLYALKLPLPPLPEQKAIAHILSLMDTAISKNNSLISQKELQKKWLMQNLLTGKKRLKGFEKEVWKEYYLGELYKNLKGQLLSKDKVEESGKFKCILYGELFTTYNEVIQQVESKTNCNEGTLSEYGDILMPGSTTTTGIDLTVTSVLLEESVLLGGDIIILRKKNDLTDPIFMSYFLTNSQKRQILRMPQGITIVHIYGRDLLGIKFLIPSKETQVAISQILQEANKEIQLLKSKSEKLKEKKKWLMQVLLTGKLRVKIS